MNNVPNEIDASGTLLIDLSGHLAVTISVPITAARLPCSRGSLLLALQGYCVPGCAEDVIGITFYKYILTNVASINGVELLSAIGKKCLHMESLIDAPWVSLRRTHLSSIQLTTLHLLPSVPQPVTC